MSSAQIEAHSCVYIASEVGYIFLHQQWNGGAAPCRERGREKSLNHWGDAAANLWSPLTVPWIWAAYCKFQSTSSIEGRLHDSREIHLLIMESTIDSDSCEQVACTIGSIIRFWPSRELIEACKMRNLVSRKCFSYTMHIYSVVGQNGSTYYFI